MHDTRYVMRGRRSYRRLEPLHVGFAIVWFLGLSMAAYAARGEGSGVVVALLACAAVGTIAIYLLGPAASIVVTGQSIVVNNPYLSYEVPRQLVDRVRYDSLAPRLVLITGDSVRLAALNLNLPRGYPLHAGRHQQRSLAHMLAEIPEQRGGAAVSRSVRYGNVVLAAAALFAFAAAARQLLSHTLA
jgi:hypothetical protein